MVRTYESMAGELADQIRRALPESKVIMVTGEALWKIYNRPEVVAAFQEALSNQVRFKIMTGPVTSVDDEGHNNLLCLWENDKSDQIELYRPQTRSLLHYRILQTESGVEIYAEYPHKPGAEAADRRPMEIKEDDKEFWARKLEEDFDNHVKAGIAKRVEKGDNEAFYRLSLEEIQRVSAKAASINKPYDFLTVDEIKALCA